MLLQYCPPSGCSVYIEGSLSMDCTDRHNSEDGDVGIV